MTKRDRERDFLEEIKNYSEVLNKERIDYLNKISKIDSSVDLETSFNERSKTDIKGYVTEEKLKQSEERITNLVWGITLSIAIAVIGLLLDGWRDHVNIDRIILIQTELNNAITENKQLKQEIEELRKEFDSKLENEINKAIIEVYKLKLTRK